MGTAELRLAVKIAEARDRCVRGDLVVAEAVPAVTLGRDAEARGSEISVVVLLALERVGGLALPEDLDHLRIDDVQRQVLRLRRRRGDHLLLGIRERQWPQPATREERRPA